MPTYWRIRFNSGGWGDFSRRVWDRDEIGIWYGAWTADDFAAAASQAKNSAEIASRLSALPAQQQLWPVTAASVATARRFMNKISGDDWVVFYLADTQEIGLAQVQGQARSDPSHPINLPDGQLFKYRKIVKKKTFKLQRLPDVYWLLSAQGRSNVYRIVQMKDQVKFLAENANEEAVNRAFRLMPFDELLTALSASSWESFCYAYLVWEEDFVPTGLSTGRTLPVVDIIGRRRDGSRIFAQCKKDPHRQPIRDDFRTLAETLGPNDRAFYFAYGGCRDKPPRNVRVIDRTFALQWADSKNGQLYKKLLLGEAPTH